MASPARHVYGFTRTELLVTFAVIAVIGILLSLAVPAVTVGPVKSVLIQAVNNERQIYMASMSMATDGSDGKDPYLGWPGDLKAKGHITTLADYVNLLARNGYIKPGDLRIFSGPGYKPYQGKLTSGSNGVLNPAFTEENCAFKVYLVKESDSSNTVFLAGKNYTYNTDLSDPKAKPFGDKGFVVARKGGDVSLYRKSQAHNLQGIGGLPGGGIVENADNCLNPGPTAPR